MASARTRQDVFRIAQPVWSGPERVVAGEPRTPQPLTVTGFPTQARR